VGTDLLRGRWEIVALGCLQQEQGIHIRTASFSSGCHVERSPYLQRRRDAGEKMDALSRCLEQLYQQGVALLWSSRTANRGTNEGNNLINEGFTLLCDWTGIRMEKCRVVCSCLKVVWSYSVVIRMKIKLVLSIRIIPWCDARKCKSTHRCETACWPQPPTLAQRHNSPTSMGHHSYDSTTSLATMAWDSSPAKFHGKLGQHRFYLYYHDYTWTAGPQNVETMVGPGTLPRDL